jgi:hypothetical protein
MQALDCDAKLSPQRQNQSGAKGKLSDKKIYHTICENIRFGQSYFSFEALYNQ